MEGQKRSSFGYDMSRGGRRGGLSVRPAVETPYFRLVTVTFTLMQSIAKLWAMKYTNYPNR